MRMQDLHSRSKGRLMLVLLVICSCCFLETYSQVNTWQSRQSLPANPRFLSVGFSIGNKGYLGLGFNYSNEYKDFWEYDPASNTWSQKADFGGGLRHAAVGFSIGNKGYVGTGSDLSPSDHTTDFWEYDPATNAWMRKADFPGGSRTVAQGFTIGNKGYLGLGRTGNYSTLYKDFWEYDPTTDVWTRKADFGGSGRWASSGFSIGTKGYIGTGTDFSGGGFTYLKDFYEYDQATDVWTRKADFGGSARELAVGFSINQRGYIGTGLGNSDFWEYNPLTNSWTQKATFAGGGRNMSTGFAIGNKGYISTGAGGQLHNDLWAYTAAAVPPSTQWAKQSNGPLAGYTAPSLTTDPDGNIYVAGTFVQTLTFATSPSQTVLTTAGQSDVFIAKYDPAGNVLWAKRVGGTFSESANGIRFDGHGNLYVVGSFNSSTNFDGTILSNPANEASNAYIAKFNAASGNLLWAKQGTAGSPYTEQTVWDVAVDSDGNAYITGYFGIVTFDPLPTLYTTGWWDLFVVKYNSSGVPVWQTTAGSAEAGYYAESGHGIEVDPSGNVFVTGSINGSSTFPTYFGNIQVVSNGGGGFYEKNFFLAKYNQSTSSWEWAVEGGGPSNDHGESLSLDNQGNLYVSGIFEATAVFGSNTFVSTGGRDYFIGKYSSSGQQQWIQAVQGGGFNVGNSSQVDANGNFHFAGTFDGTVVVGDQTLTSQGYDNAYVGSWNTDGAFQWAKHIPGNYYSQVYALEVDNYGSIITATVFSGTETFDCTVFNGTSNGDLAIAKFGYTSGAVAPTVQASENEVCSGGSTALSIVNSNLNNATQWKWYSGSCGGVLVGAGSSITVSPTQTTTYFVRSEGGCAGPGNCGSITITVNSSQSSITSVSAPLAPTSVNTSVDLTVTSTGTLSAATINWGDGGTAEVISNPSNNLVVPHTYTTPGVYTVTTTVTNTCNITSEINQYQYIVVYDPNGNFVTGGGWINSQAGAYRTDVTLSGKANFGFESKYLKGSNQPSGNTEFKFHVGNMNFKSISYEWLVVAGSRAQFKGIGTINGSGNYGFMLTAIDGALGSPSGPDLFRIKIWDINSNGAIVYDNQYGIPDDGQVTTQLGGGAIVIHNNKSNASEAPITRNQVLEVDRLTVMAAPNPSAQYFRLKIQSNGDAPVSLRVTDLLGRVIESRVNVVRNGEVIIGEKYHPGVYLAEIIQRNQKQVIKLIKQ